MLSDLEASQLISESLQRELTDEERKLVQQHLDESPDSRDFKQISELIQNSIARQAKSLDDDSAIDGLTDSAKKRLKDSIRSAQSSASEVLVESKGSSARSTHRDQPSSLASLVAETQASYSTKSEPVESRQLISRYTLIRSLGAGGLGNVWLARDEKLKRNVVVKELNPNALESPKLWQRFQREAEITGHLEHPNVVPLYQYGLDTESGNQFYAMRFVGKQTLSDAIIEHHARDQSGEDRGLGLHRLLTAFLGVCQAIAYAHSRGVIHRDLKPDNVALDNFGQVIVLDWGLAKLVDDAELSFQLPAHFDVANDELARTMQGDIIGTPLYMAPEQAASNLDDVDQRTDVYGLGAILFAILTGSAPHEKSLGGSEVTNVLEVIKAISENQSPKPSDFVDALPRELERICIKAMEYSRYKRFESVAALAADVERWIAGQSQKASQYEKLRMEGRELRADLQSAVRNLEKNVRFMSKLPPIAELTQANGDTKVGAWRERLTTIFKGLLSANKDFINVVYSRVDGEQFTELVRTERHSTDSSNIRNVPKSRLKTDVVSNYIRNVINQKPEEVLTSLVCNPLCDKSKGCMDKVRLVAATPVFDEETEEPFGVVMIDCDIDQVMRRQLNKRMTADEVVIACDIHAVMMHVRDGHVVEESIDQKVADAVPSFEPAIRSLRSHLEFIDETDAEIYGARIWLVPNEHGLMYVLRRNSI